MVATVDLPSFIFGVSLTAVIILGIYNSKLIEKFNKEVLFGKSKTAETHFTNRRDARKNI